MKKGFTLIEMIVVLVLLAFIAIIISISLGKISDGKSDAQYTSFIDRVKSASLKYINDSFDDYFYNGSDTMMSINALIESGLLDIDEINNIKNNNNYQNNLKYDLIRIYIDNNETLQIEYPVLNTKYIKIRPHIEIVGKNKSKNLLKTSEVFIYDNNQIANDSINNIIIMIDDKVVDSNYTFLEEKNYVITYKYNDLLAYRFIKVASEDCNLVLNTEDKDDLYLELNGSEIKSFQLTINEEMSNTTNYTSKIVKKFTGLELSQINNIKVKCNYKNEWAVTKTDEISVDYDNGITYDDLSNSIKCANYTNGSEPYLMTYSGNCEIIKDLTGDWQLKLLTSGNLTFNRETKIDAFIVGGGGGGGDSTGGGGFNTTKYGIKISQNAIYPIVVGGGGAAGYNLGMSAYWCSPGSSGGKTKAFGYEVSGGGAGGAVNPGTGGETGGGCYGINPKSGIVTGAFGTAASPGNSYSERNNLGAGKANTGMGGGNVKAGGSGIVIIRNTIAHFVGSNSFYYDDGYYNVTSANTESWVIKLKTSGSIKFLEDIDVDIFMVGGGGGGAYDSGGAGHNATYSNVHLTAETSYPITIGGGGAAGYNLGMSAYWCSPGASGSETTGFGYIVSGGSGEGKSYPGTGGENGGGCTASAPPTSGTEIGAFESNSSSNNRYSYRTASENDALGKDNTGSGGSGTGGSGVILIRKHQ